MTTTLLLADAWPWPAHTGARQRTMWFIDALRALGAVDFIGRKPLQPDADLEVPGVRRRVWLGDLEPAPAAERFRALLAAERYDLVMTRFYQPASWLLDSGIDLPAPLLVDIDDVLNFDLYRRAYAGGGRNLVRHALGYLRASSAQRRVIRRAGAVVAANAGDLPLLRRHAVGPVHCIPNAVKTEGWEAFDASAGFANVATLLFVGTLNYAPNVAGLRWLATEAWPEIRRRGLATTLIVAGNNPSPAARRLCEADGVRLMASVPDIRDAYRAAGVVVVPVFEGGGSRIKILEAGLARRPVVSTPKGRDGLDLEPGTALLEFETVEDLCAALTALQTRATYERLADEAAARVLDRYTVGTFERNVHALVATVLKGAER